MSTPILLEGSNLGERRRHLNRLVTETLQQNVDLTEILQAQEKTPVDRVFKIDLASKHRYLEYILNNLKDDDMLYVSRALKSLWLLEPQYREVINPRHLEDEVFPHMIQPAVNKMRHWLQRNITDPQRCQEFYEYYKDHHEIAIKFLWHCSPDYIMTVVKNILHKLSPQDLKVLCEICPQTAQVYFEALQTNKEALSHYIKSEENYFKSIQCVLKMNPSLYLDIMEKYFNLQKFRKLSPKATRYIMKNHKDRFSVKLELYTAHFLHTKSLASFITSVEAKTIILQIAQAEYLESWFTFKNLEPLILKVNVNERAALKKQIFVDKNVGDKVKEWKHPIPTKVEQEIIRDRNIFKDKETNPICLDRSMCFKRMLKKRKYGNWDAIQQKSSLDLLFDKYRFKSFNNAFHELTQKLLSEGTIEGRMNILLVLVSKSGGVPEQVAKLLTLLVSKHMNEPSNLRAAVVRSLVKRAAAWRLPDDTWNMMMMFGHDLGLDGRDAELQCIEGLHAVLLRHLINDIRLPDAIKTTFLKDISTLKDYKLNVKERKLVGPRLAKILLDNEPNSFLDILVDYKLKINNIADAEMIVVERARTDIDLARRLLDRRIGRRFLLKESFKLIDNNDSYMNALKHDTSVLENGSKFAYLVKEKRPHHDRFLQSLALYFNEPNGLAEQHNSRLVDAMKSNPQPWFARAINILSTKALSNLLKEVDAIEIREVNKKQLAASFRTTAHKIRPTLDIKIVDWKWLGAKAIANNVFICRENDRESYVSLLLQWRRTARIAIRLGLSSKSSKETFIAASKLRPAAALKMATKTYLRNKTIDPEVWEVIKKLIKDLVTDKTSKYLRKSLKSNKSLPDNIKSEYWVLMYEVCLRINKRDATNILCRIENVLPYVDDNIIRNIIDKFLNEYFVFENIISDDYDKTENHALYLRIMVKHLLVCTSEIEQEERLDNVCDVFFDKAVALNATLGDEAKKELYGLLYKVVTSLKYNKVFLGNYVCSLPVIERITENMKKILPIEQYFALYVELRIIMLYDNSLKESMKEKPGTFENLDKDFEDAIEMVGVKFGEKLDIDIKELTTEYFFSIVEVYKHVLVAFLHNFEYETEQNPITLPMLKGLFSKSRTESLVLTQHILSGEECSFDQRDKILNTLKSYNNTIFNMFVYADT